MPARIVALACSVWATMAARAASRSPRGERVDHVAVVLGDVRGELDRRA